MEDVVPAFQNRDVDTRAGAYLGIPVKMLLGAGGDALNPAIPTIPTYPLTWRLAKHKPAGDKGDLSPFFFSSATREISSHAWLLRN
jgi:hypothetical protein